MGSNSFGNLFKITTFGESHGAGVGVVIDGCPPGFSLAEECFLTDMAARRPGKDFVSGREEEDKVEILSGTYEGVTTGHPIALFIKNREFKSNHYTQEMLRPGHAHFTYLSKYGIFDPRGGGRASARETAARVAAGVVAKKVLEREGIQIFTWLHSVGEIEEREISSFDARDLPLFFRDSDRLTEVVSLLKKLKEEGDSIGGIVGFQIEGAPIGLGDPIYEKLEARLAFAMMSLPASKGFEIGEGFSSTRFRGSSHNDSFTFNEGAVKTKTNHAGGLLGGISTGSPIFGKVAFKPTSSIFLPQDSVTIDGKVGTFNTHKEGRHDPCVAIRATPVVSAMCALVMVDALLMNQKTKNLAALPLV